MKTIPVRQIRSGELPLTHRGKFSIRKLNEVLKGQYLKHELNRHDFYFILALKGGKGSHVIDFVQHKVADNMVFILRPGQVHELELEGDCEGYLIEFDNAFYPTNKPANEKEWKKVSNRNHFLLDNIRFTRLENHLNCILAEHSKREEGYQNAIKSYLDLIIIELSRESGLHTTIPDSKSNFFQERYEELQRLLESRITEIKSVSQYAALLNLSVFQLNNITKSLVDKSVTELINEQILLEAKRFLLATSNQVKEIAWHLGYEDPSYFIRFFKKHTGQSPDSFRKNFK